MWIEIKDLETNLSDSNYANELLEQLKLCHDNFDTHAMTDWKLFKEGQLNMLGQIIKYIEFTK